MTNSFTTAFLEECQRVIETLPTLVSTLPFYIRTEEEGYQVIYPNRVQLHYHKDRVVRGFDAHDAILKARKHGFSTWKILEALALCLFVEGFSAAIIVHEKETAARVFKILRWAYDRLPDEVKEEKPLNEDRRDAIEVGGSTVYVYTAGGRGVGRSETFHSLHMTEVAFWPDAEDTVAGLTEAVPRFGHICYESTPSGREGNGAYWYEVCRLAGENQSSYKLHFYPWWWGDENAIPLTDGELVVPTEEEQDIILAARKGGFELTPEQLKWRRSKLFDLKEKFFQEHPEDPETCFLVSGNPIIDPHLLRRLVQRSEAALILEQTTMPGMGERIVWKRPNGLHPYVVAVDVAEGLPHRDWSVISTWQDTPDGLVNVARTRLLCSTDELAVRAVNEAKEYMDALIIVERNSIGSNVVRRIEEAGYEHQYHQLDRDGQETDHNGWITNVRSKKLMIEEFAADTHAGIIHSFDRELWAESMNVYRDDMGRPTTPKKKHDDIFVSACMANQAKEQSRRKSQAIVVSYL